MVFVLRGWTADFTSIVGRNKVRGKNKNGGCAPPFFHAGMVLNDFAMANEGVY
jgi:hypothetical protein